MTFGINLQLSRNVIKHLMILLENNFKNLWCHVTSIEINYRAKMSFFGVTHIAIALSASGAYFYCFFEAIYDRAILRTHSDEPKNKT
jgi:hypothetical protein